MLLKKFCSMLLALTLVIACIPGTMASAAESVWFDLEAESGTLVHRTAVLTDETTGRGYMISNDANRANSSTIPFSREASGTYDIWAVIGVDDSNFIGGYTFTLGSEEAFYSKSIEKANLDAVGDTLYTSDQLSGGKHHKPMKWVKLASGKTIDAGDHTLVAAVTKATATENCYGVIDVVRFVPSSWKWTPSSNFADPTVSDWFDVEAESGTGFTKGKIENGGSGGAFISYGFAQYDTAGESETITMTFEAAKSGTYDMWIVAGQSNTNNIVPIEITLNGNTYTQPQIGYSEYLYTMYNGNGWPQPMFWHNTGTGIALEAGTTYTMTAKITAANHSSKYYMNGLDVVRFVPSEWNWQAGNSFAAPTDMRVAPDANGLIYMEAENGKLSGAFSKYDDAAASGGSYVASLSIQGNNPGYTTLAFRTDERAVYDIWAAVATHESKFSHLGGLQAKLDSEVIYEKGNSGVSRANPDLWGKTITLLGAAGDDGVGTVRWVKLGRKIVEPGGHTIVVGTYNSYSSYHTNGLIDSVALVPATWDWTAGNTFTIAKQFTLKDGSFAWIEGEDMTPVNEDAKQVSVGKAGGTPSGGSEIFRNARSGADASFAPEFTVDFYVENAGTYEIWNYGYVVGGLTHFGKMVATINGVTTTGRSNYESVTNGEGGTDGQIKRWDRLAPPEEQQITLNAGWNTLNVKYLHGGTHNLFCTDAIAIVPTSWNWNPELESMKEGENPVNAYKMAPKLDAFSAGKYLGSKSGTVTENLTLADRGAAGSTITYVSTNPAISNTGVVTAPSRWDGNALGTIVATATKGALSASTDAVNFTVEADALLNYSSFEIVGDIVSNGLVYAMANDVVSAHADAKTAVVILAVYKDDALLGVYPSEVKDITGEAQTIVSGIATLPEDTTGVTVKAFIWNGLETAMPYVSPISK